MASETSEPRPTRIARWQLSILRAHLESRSQINSWTSNLITTLFVLFLVTVVSSGLSAISSGTASILAFYAILAFLVMAIAIEIVLIIMLLGERKIQRKIRAYLNLLAQGTPVSHDNFVRLLYEIS